MTKQFEYPNGLRLIVKQMDGLLSVTTGIIVGVGSVCENSQTNGISHFIEHMLFKGTEKRSSFDISDGIDRLGAQINAFTSKETTCFYTKSTIEHTGEAFEILSDMFFNSRFAESEMETEKGVVLEEINMCEDSPEDLCSDVLASAYFGERDYGRTILGTAENVKSFTKSDIQKHMSAYYTPGNIVISFAGNICFDDADALVRKFFLNGFAMSGGRMAGIEAQPQFLSLAKSKDIEQAHINIAFEGIKYDDPLFACYMIANTALGGGMSSRLFQTIREKQGLAYSVYSYPNSYKTMGSFCVYAGVNPSKLAEAYRSILDEIENFRRGITPDEFKRGREQIKGSFMLSQESTATQMLQYGKYLLYTDKTFDFNRHIACINSVTLDQINSVIAERFSTEKLARALVARDASPL